MFIRQQLLYKCLQTPLIVHESCGFLRSDLAGHVHADTRALTLTRTSMLDTGSLFSDLILSKIPAGIGNADPIPILEMCENFCLCLCVSDVRYPWTKPIFGDIAHTNTFSYKTLKEGNNFFSNYHHTMTLKHRSSVLFFNEWTVAKKMLLNSKLVQTWKSIYSRY